MLEWFSLSLLSFISVICEKINEVVVTKINHREISLLFAGMLVGLIIGSILITCFVYDALSAIFDNVENFEINVDINETLLADSVTKNAYEIAVREGLLNETEAKTFLNNSGVGSYEN